VIEDKSLYPKFREGGETVVFKANDFADPAHSEVFQRLLAMPKLKEQARRFAAVCEAPLAAAPTLDEYLAGNNIPAAKAQITTRPSPTTRSAPASYISAYPVVDALNFSAAMQRVGDRVELIGRIVEVKPGARKARKGPPKRYVFINFGSSRGNILKISIWSEGLAKLKEKPSTAWVGRWVSVTGLIDVPYENKRSGHKHLSITVLEDGQIQQLSETEAGFRLASMSAAPPPRSRSAEPAAVPATPPAKAPAAAPPSKPARAPATAKATKAKPKSVLSRGSRKARSPKSAASSTPPSPPAPQPPQSRGLLDWLWRWMS
jgi:hypothetical protein